jgi:signal peptidase I
MSADLNRMTNTSRVTTEKPILPAPTKPSPRNQSLVGQTFQCLCIGVLALASYLVISRYFVTTVEVVGSSMVPTLRNSDHYLLNRWVYHFREPKRMEVVVLRDPGGGCFAVKRVIGVEGDSVLLKNGAVYLNGEKLTEPYLARNTPTFPNGRANELMIFCGKDQFYVMGDNRMNSADSRTYGPIRRENILGLVVR